MAGDEASQRDPRTRAKLPFTENADFHNEEVLRGDRLAHEFNRVDAVLRDLGIVSTIVVFGSSRIPSPEKAEEQRQGSSSEAGKGKKRAPHSNHSHWYEVARAFGKIVSERGGALNPSGMPCHNVIATGGGPGIMEAANRGAAEAGAPSIGFNILLPKEQPTNPYTTPALTFQFHYFAMRKMHLAMRANALAVFPGGFGTLDELFEILTLKQTQKGAEFPIVLFDRSYWAKVVNFRALVELGMISRDEAKLFDLVDTAEEGWDVMVKRGLATCTHLQEP